MQRIVGICIAYALVLVKIGLLLEYVTLAWNVVGVVILTVAALKARSVAQSAGVAGEQPYLTFDVRSDPSAVPPSCDFSGR
jgi:hypothetical protein